MAAIATRILKWILWVAIAFVALVIAFGLRDNLPAQITAARSEASSLRQVAATLKSAQGSYLTLARQKRADADAGIARLRKASNSELEEAKRGILDEKLAAERKILDRQELAVAAEVHRRMAEIYGEREGTRRMTNMVLQSQASWGAIESKDKDKRIERKKAKDLKGAAVAAWLAEACLRSSGRPIPTTSVDSNPLIFPFELGGSIAYLLSKSPALELRTDGSGNQIVSLAVPTIG